MGSYSILGGGVEVSNMSPVFSTGMQLQKPMYIMQEAPKPAPQQVWVHAVPANNSQPVRPAATPTMVQAAQPQTVPTVYSAAPRPLVAAQPQVQPTTYMAQAPGAMRLVQLPGGGVQVQQAQPQQQQMVLAQPQQPQQLQQRQAGNEVVYVNVNGVLQQGVVQNGSVYLLRDSAAPAAGSTMMQVQAAPGQQAPMGVSVAPRQPGIAAAPMTVSANTAAQVVQLPNGQFQQQQQQMQVAGQQQVMMQQVLPAGARLVPVSQAAARPMQLPQQQVQAQQQQAQRPMMMVMQPNGAQPALVQSSAPMGMVVVSGAQRAGMQQAVPKQVQVQLPMQTQQLVNRNPTVVPAAAAARSSGVQAQQMVQPMQFSNGAAMQQQQMRLAAAPLNGMGVASAAAPNNSQQASAQAFRPALAAGAKILMPGTSVSASTASLGNKASAAPAAVGPQQSQLAVPPNNGSGMPASQAVMVPGSSLQQQQQLAPGLSGDMSSPPVPPITPGVVLGAPAPAAPGNANGSVKTDAGSTLLALLNGGNSNGSPRNGMAGSGGDNAIVRMGAGSQSPSHGIIGSQRNSKDGTAASRSGTPAPAGSSPPRSQPGTPARSNSGGGLVAVPAAAAAAAGVDRSANNNKGAVMRLVAMSFIETGIALEQALAMVQPADSELLAAAFAAEAAGEPMPDSVPAAAAGAGDASTAAAEMGGVGSMLGGLGLGLGFDGTVKPAASTTTDATAAATGSSSNSSKGLFGGEGLSGLLSLSFVDDVSCANDNNSINMGSWGFSLFTGSGMSELNGGTAGLSSLGPADPLLADVAAAPAAAQQPGGAAGKDSALAGMLASLNL